MSLAEDITNIGKDRQAIFIAEIIHALTIEGRFAYSPHGEHSIEKCGIIFEDIHRASGHLTTLLVDGILISDLASKSLASMIEKLSKSTRERLYNRFALTTGA